MSEADGCLTTIAVRGQKGRKPAGYSISCCSGLRQQILCSHFIRFLEGCGQYWPGGRVLIMNRKPGINGKAANQCNFSAGGL